VDFRVSIIPSYYGESAVIRIPDPSGLPQSVEGLDLREPVAAKLRQLLRSSTGIILVTGPTGSGKSTTLFGALKSVYQSGIKILTTENPIEYVCDAFRQHEVDERLGNTFAKYLRSFLRHDPDVIMIGEIRDSETADLAFRAAQTGHLVLRHANFMAKARGDSGTRVRVALTSRTSPSSLRRCGLAGVILTPAGQVGNVWRQAELWVGGACGKSRTLES
jgi:type II secretory ATPase GspE/PulE/Tfp pilus assembly ATPase PilB-like protein